MHRNTEGLRTLVLRAQAYASFRQVASKASGRNVAQGDTLVPSKEKEIANAAKGDELTQPRNLESTTITRQGQAFIGDLRSTSGLGLGDGLTSHTAKWFDPKSLASNAPKVPMEYIQESQPIKVHGAVVASYGSENPALGCPVEYISLKGTTREQPAVCKYTGNKYYSEDWHLAH